MEEVMEEYIRIAEEIWFWCNAAGLAVVLLKTDTGKKPGMFAFSVIVSAVLHALLVGLTVIRYGTEADAVRFIYREGAVWAVVGITMIIGLSRDKLRKWGAVIVARVWRGPR
jgi:hypothetical protein